MLINTLYELIVFVVTNFLCNFNISFIVLIYKLNAILLNNNFMTQSKTELTNKEQSGEIFKFIFTNNSYKDYKIDYNFITGHLRLLLPNENVFYCLKVKAFLNPNNIIDEIKSNSTLMLLIDIFLIEANPYGNESKDFIETEERLNLKTLLESKRFN